MASLAFDIENGQLIDLHSLLADQTFEQLNAQYADRPSQYCCAECLSKLQGLSQEQLLAYRTSGLTPDSSFRRGGPMTIVDIETGDPKTVQRRPAFVHTTPLLDEEGNRLERPCESDFSIHHGYCRWIAESSGQRWLLGSGFDGDLSGVKADRHVISIMARYIKDPSHREPDISVLWANSHEDARELSRRFASGDRQIDWSLCSGLTAVEVQKSQISKPELIQRTCDHLKHFQQVRWVFTPGNKPVPPREWLADEGLTAYVLEEEFDNKIVKGVFELPPPKKTRTYDQKRTRQVCLRAILLYWLGQGCLMPEALSRAKADLQEISSGNYLDRLSPFEKAVDSVFPWAKFEPKEIWLRHQHREASK
jgi:hypothetical protein